MRRSQLRVELVVWRRTLFSSGIQTRPSSPSQEVRRSMRHPEEPREGGPQEAAPHQVEAPLAVAQLQEAAHQVAAQREVGSPRWPAIG